VQGTRRARGSYRRSPEVAVDTRILVRVPQPLGRVPPPLVREPPPLGREPQPEPQPEEQQAASARGQAPRAFVPRQALPRRESS